MRFKIAFILFFLQIAFVSNGQNFYRSYGNTDDEVGRSVTETSDSLFFIFGTSSSFVNGTSNFYLVHIDSLGNFLWSKTYGGNGIEQGYDIAKKPNGNYLLTGFSNSFGNGGYDIYSIEIDSTGSIIWENTYGGTDWDFAYCNLALPSGESIISGSTYSFGNGNQDGFLMKIDNNGDSVWFKTYGNTNENVIRKTALTSSGELISTGYTITAAGDKDFYVVKTKSDGDTIWTRTYGSPFNEEGFSVTETRYGNYLFTGYTDSIVANGKDIYYFETDTSGTVTWYSYLGLTGDEIMNAAVMHPGNNKFHATSETSSFGSGEFDFMITTYFAGGGWYDIGNTYGTLYTEKPYDLIYTRHKRLLAVGSTNYPYENTNVMAVMTDTLYPPQNTLNNYIDVTAITETDPVISGFTVYPNPANDVITIKSDLTIKTIEIYETSGRLVRTYPNGFTEIHLDQLPATVYLLKTYFVDETSATHRLVITRR